MRKLLFGCLVALVGALASPAPATAFPDKPVTLIVPYAPGGLGTTFGTFVTENMSPLLGQRMIVDYRPGANGGLGAASVARAAPDGYTLLMAVNSTMAVNPNLYPNLQYDPVKDFAPVGMIYSSSNILVVNAASPIRSVKDLVAAAKAAPGKLTYGSSGNGATPHLSGEMFRKLAGVNVTHIPYKGIGPAVLALLGGEVDFVFSDTSALPQIAAGKLRALAVTAPKRLTIAPDLPTLEEEGLPGFVVTTWYSLVAPARTPPEVVARLSRDIETFIREPKVAARMREIGVEPPEDTSPGFLAATIKSDLAKWRAFVTETGLKLD